TDLGSHCAVASLSRGHELYLRTRLDHCQLLAGLVRNYSIAGWLDHGFNRRACHCGALRRRLGYLRKRGRVPGRETLNQAVRRIHRSEEHTSELQSLRHLVCRLLLEKKKIK